MAVESVLEIDRWRRRYSTKRFADYYARDYLWQFQALITGVTEGAMSQGRMASLNLEPRRRSAVYNSLPNRSSVRSKDRSLWYSTRNWGWKWCRVATGNREHVECDGNQLKTAPPRPYNTSRRRRSVSWSTVSNMLLTEPAASVSMLRSPAPKGCRPAPWSQLSLWNERPSKRTVVQVAAVRPHSRLQVVEKLSEASSSVGYRQVGDWSIRFQIGRIAVGLL